MIDVATRQRLMVSTIGTAGPYIRLPANQLPEVQQLLDKGGIYYWVEEEIISFNGGPEIAVVDLGRGGDADAVQSLLDSAT